MSNRSPGEEERDSKSEIIQINTHRNQDSIEF